MWKRLKANAGAFFLVTSAAAMLLTNAESAAAGVRAGLNICAETIVPSLFPFMVLSSFFVHSGLASFAGRLAEPAAKKIFGLPGCAGGVLVMGLIGGYPIGAGMTAQMVSAKMISKKEGARMMLFCINAGPAFVVGAVGCEMLGSRKAGLILFAAIALASLIMALASGFFFKEKSEQQNLKKQTTKKTTENALALSVADASGAILSVCSWVLLFSCVCSMPFFPEGVAGTALRGLFEVTTGCRAATEYPLPVLALILGWGSLSIHCQVSGNVRKTDIKMSMFLLGRLANAVLAALICHVLITLFPCEINVAAVSDPVLGSALSTSAPASAAMLLMGAILILDMGKKKGLINNFDLGIR